jgi:hypothetical protein
MTGRLFIPIFLLLLLGACADRPKTSEGILSENKMVQMLVDTHLTDAILFTNNGTAEEKRDKALFYYPSLLEKHGITRAQMDSSVAWYTRHPEAFSRVYAKVIEDLQKRQAAVKVPDKTDE